MSRRRYPRVPLVGVAGIVYGKGRVLLIRRGNPPGRGRWNFPGGLVEVGETLKEAVTREVREETGLEVEVRELVAVGDRIVRDEEGRVVYHYILLDYLCEVTGGTLCPASDAMDARWLTSRQVEAYHLAEPVRSVLEKAERLTCGFTERKRV